MDRAGWFVVVLVAVFATLAIVDIQRRSPANQLGPTPDYEYIDRTADDPFARIVNPGRRTIHIDMSKVWQIETFHPRKSPDRLDWFTMYIHHQGGVVRGDANSKEEVEEFIEFVKRNRVAPK